MCRRGISMIILAHGSVATTAIGCLVSNSWLVIWALLEINTLAFCCLTNKNKKNSSSQHSEFSMKYFVIQSIASAILLFSMFIFKTKESLKVPLLVMGAAALAMKMASFPFHQWFLSILPKGGWGASTLLLTWQKLAPIFLIMYQWKFVIKFMIISSAVGSSILQMAKFSFMEIMALSSVFNISWLLLSNLISIKAYLAFSLLYWTTVLLVMMTIKSTKSKNVSLAKAHNIPKPLTAFMLANLAGIPPMAGFLAKWMLAMEALKQNVSLMVSTLLIMSGVNFFVYLRFLSPSHITKSSSHQSSLKVQKMLVFFVPWVSIGPVFLTTL